MPRGASCGSPGLAPPRGRWIPHGAARLLLIAALAASGCSASSASGSRTGGAGTPRSAIDCPRPYSSDGPWNTPIASAAVAPDSAQLVATIASPLTSDPTQYTYPVYTVGDSQPRLPVYVANIASIVTNANRLHRTRSGAQLEIPIPPGAQPGSGSDDQVIVWNPRTGDEWGFWQFTNSVDPLTQSVPSGTGTRQSPLPVRNAYADFWEGSQIVIGVGAPDAEAGRILVLPDANHMILAGPTRSSHRAGEQVWGIGASNGYYYNTALSGVPPHGFASRGAGVPYLAGLVRKCEIEQGHIDHALAFIYPHTTGQFIFPATKSDGHSAPGQGLPEGARLQLDPYVSDRVIRQVWGCRDACFVIAKALQRYGMYLVDTGGRAKIAVEDDSTAHWTGMVNASTVSPIPVSSLRLVR